MTEEKKSENEPVVPGGSDTWPGSLEEIRIKKYLSHDGLFRAAFENAKLVESFTRENLPAEITENLDFSTMEQDKDTLIDQHLTRVMRMCFTISGSKITRSTCTFCMNTKVVNRISRVCSS